MGETASVGVLEWKVYATPVAALRPVHVPTLAGTVPPCRPTATKIYADGARVDAPVTWQPISPADVQQPATSFGRVGVVEGTALVAEATVYVRLTDAVSVTSIAEEQVVTPGRPRPRCCRPRWWPPSTTARATA